MASPDESLDAEKARDEPSRQPIDQLPPEVIRAAVARATQSFTSVQLAMGPAPNEFVQKLEPAHITELLEANDRERKRNHDSNRLYFAGTLIAFFGISWLFLGYQKGELVEKIVLHLMSFGAGALGGYGFAKAKIS